MTKRIRALFNMQDIFLLISDINKLIYGMEERFCVFLYIK